jgi:exopolyphosphatase/guanosine-5'-triphosphate,3'-diphosphate pyrophosphatase
MMAQALRASCGQPAIVEAYLRMASADQLHRASAWGLANRLARKIGGGTRISLRNSMLRREEGTLVLRIKEDRAYLKSDSVESELARLASWIGLPHRIEIGGI